MSLVLVSLSLPSHILDTSCAFDYVNVDQYQLSHFLSSLKMVYVLYPLDSTSEVIYVIYGWITCSRGWWSPTWIATLKHLGRCGEIGRAYANLIPFHYSWIPSDFIDVHWWLRFSLSDEHKMLEWHVACDLQMVVQWSYHHLVLENLHRKVQEMIDIGYPIMCKGLQLGHLLVAPWC